MAKWDHEDLKDKSDELRAYEKASYAHSPGYQQGSSSIATPEEINAWFKDHSEAPKRTQALQTQVGGTHYTDMAIQPIEYILANNIPFPEGNVIKYVSRWRNKGGVKDLRKSIHHLELLIEHEEAKGTL